MKLKSFIKKGLTLTAIYFVAIIIILMMAERVERLNELERMKKETEISMKFSK